MDSLNRTIRVFISSTFSDMKEEREELMTHAWPELRRFCHERFVELVEVDLRWGISEERSQRKEVLKICLDEIYDCQVFIGVLGERYGSIPARESFNDGLLKQHKWIEEFQDHSITELEILHGFLNEPQTNRKALFYFRDPNYSKDRGPGFVEEHPGDISKLDNLKDRIRHTCNVYNVPIREGYAGPKELSALIIDDLKAVIEGVYPLDDNMDRFTLGRIEHEAFAANRRRVYIQRKDYFEKLDQSASGSVAGPLVITGKSGTGKSALIANWVKAWKDKHPRDFIFQHYIGGPQESASHWLLIFRLIVEMKYWTKDPEELPNNPEETLKSFGTWLVKLRLRAESRGVNAIILLDALNQVEDVDKDPGLGWLPTHPFTGSLRLIVSSLPEHASLMVQEKGWELFKVSSLSIQERKGLIDGYLNYYSKSLDTAPLERIAAVNAAQNPLYLKTLLDELRVKGTYALLDEQIDDYLSTPDITSLIGKILVRYQEDYEYGRPGLVKDAFSFIWVARNGLSEAELLQLLRPDDKPQLPQAIWSPLRAAMDELVIGRAGTLSFAHNYLRSAVELFFLPDEKEKEKYSLQLVDYFNCEKQNPRRLTELPWQLSRLQRWKQLVGFLGGPEDLAALYRSNRLDVKRYWVQIEKHSAFRMQEVYKSAIDNPASLSLKAALTISDLLDETNYPDQAIALLNKILEEDSSQDDPDTKVACMNHLGLLYKNKGRLREASLIFRECSSLAKEEGMSNLEYASILNEALALVNLGEIELAHSKLKEAEQFFRQKRDYYNLLTSLLPQTNILRSQGNLVEAKALLKEAEGIAALFNLEEKKANVKLGRAIILQTEGYLDTSEKLLQETEPFFEQSGNTSELAEVYNFRGLIHKSRGEFEEALHYQDKALKHYQNLGYLIKIAEAKGNKAEVLIRLARFQEAAELNGETIEVFRNTGNKRELAVALVNKGLISHKLGKQKQSEYAFQEAESLSSGLGYMENFGRALCGLGILKRAEKEIKRAKNYFDQAVEVFKKANAIEGLIAAYSGRGELLFSDLGQREMALQDFEAVIDISKQFGYRSALISALYFVATNYRRREELPFALVAANEWIAQTNHPGEEKNCALAHLVASDIYVNSGELENAEAMARQAFLYAEQGGEAAQQITALNQQVFCLRLRGKPTEALRTVDEAIQMAENHNFQFGLAQGLRLKAKILETDLEKEKEAQAILKRAIEIEKQIS